MPQNWPSRIAQLRRQVGGAVIGPPALAFLPAFCLAAYWFGGEGALIVITALLPVLYLFAGSVGDRIMVPRGAMIGPLDEPAFNELVRTTYAQAKENGRQAATFVIEIDDFKDLIDRHGHSAAETVALRVSDRVISALRSKDSLARLADNRLAVCTEPMRHMDLEMCIQLATRMQTAIEEPISIDGMTVFVTASIGFCQHIHAPRPEGDAWLGAAAIALREAQRRGPSAVRAFSDQMRQHAQAHATLCEEVDSALEDGQIRPWFQPQISTYVGYALIHVGREEEGRQLFGLAEESIALWNDNSQNMTSKMFEANLAAAKGEKDRAIQALLHAIKNGWPYNAQSPGIAAQGPLSEDAIWREWQDDPDLISALAPVRANIAKERAEVLALSD